MLIYLFPVIIILMIIYVLYSYKYYINKKIIDDRINRKNIENFNSGKQLITKRQFMQIINKEDKILWQNILEKYINNFNNVNLKSRNVNTKAELLQKYTSGFKPISTDQINKLNQIIKSNNFNLKFINKILPLIRIIKVNDNVENGYPHTHKNIVVLPDNWWINMNFTTFIHELVHIDQRINKSKYLELYELWGFNLYNKKIFGLDNILERNRVNPDGLTNNWVWSYGKYDNYWIGAVFNSKNPVNLADVKYIICKLKIHDMKLYYLDYNEELSSSNVFNDYFGNLLSNNYHPNEIVAEYISILYNKKELKGKGWEIFKTWYDRWF